MSESVYEMKTAVLGVGEDRKDAPMDGGEADGGVEDSDESVETGLYTDGNTKTRLLGAAAPARCRGGSEDETVMWRASGRERAIAAWKRLVSRVHPAEGKRFPTIAAAAVGVTAIPVVLRLFMGAATVSLPEAAADTRARAGVEAKREPLSNAVETASRRPPVYSLEADDSLVEAAELPVSSGRPVRLVDAVDALTSGRFDAAEAAYRALADAHPDEPSHALVLQILGAGKGGAR